VTRSLGEARRMRRDRGVLIAGERRGVTPAGFDCNNSPVELASVGIAGRSVVLCTSNGTRVLSALQGMPATLVGCLNNATACAEAAVTLASSTGTGVGIACAGVLGRFALDDAYAAGTIVERILGALDRAGEPAVLSDAALLAVRVRRAYPGPREALEASASGRLVRALGAGEDVTWCARVDSTASVPVLRPGRPLRIERLPAA
jgi:2-phosphosulfolactate phosphatase